VLVLRLSLPASPDLLRLWDDLEHARVKFMNNGFLSGTGVSGFLRALEQAWGRDPATMIPDVRFTPNPHDAPGGPLVERGE
jgi:ABC-type transporter Mla subunit MlaD